MYNKRANDSISPQDIAQSNKPPRKKPNIDNGTIYKALDNDREWAKTAIKIVNSKVKNTTPNLTKPHTRASEKDKISMENEPWVTPKNTKRINKKANKQSEKIFTSPNKYSTLEQENETEDTDPSTSDTESVAENKTSQTHRQQKKSKRSAIREERAPPIYLSTTTNIKAIIQQLTASSDTSNFTIKQAFTKNNTGRHSINALDRNTFEEIKNILKSNNTEFFTYTPNTEKKKLFVIKGLNETFSPQEIKLDLQGALQGVATIEKIEKIEAGNAKNKNYMIIQFSSDSNINQATKINIIAHQRIRWEIFRKRDVFQCYNCQRVGHSSKNCNLASRCIKCTENHPKGSCKLDDKQNESPTCVNCSGKHPANYRGCPYIKEAQEERNNNRRRRTENRISINKNKTNLTNLNNNTQTNNFPPLNAQFSQSQNSQYINNNQTNLKAPNNDIADIKNLINSFQEQVAQSFKQQIVNLENYKSEIINKVDDNSNKINFIFDHLGLQWPRQN